MKDKNKFFDFLKSKIYRDTSFSILDIAYKIRSVENWFLKLYKQGHLHGTIHTCVGQELSAVAICSQLSLNDVVVSNHRGHGHYISHTLDEKSLILELMGKKEGASKGIGGSQHLYGHNFFSNGIQGSIVPVAAGISFAKKFDGNDICTVFIGDGTLGEGAAYEALNLASLYKLPLLIVLEDNGIAQTTLRKDTIAGSIKLRAKAFGLKYYKCSTDDPIHLFSEASASVEFCRESRSPVFLHVETNRLNAHSKGDDSRKNEVIEKLWEKDVLSFCFSDKRFKKEAKLLDEEIASKVNLCLGSDELSINDFLSNPTNESPDLYLKYQIFESEMRVNQGLNSGLSEVLKNSKKTLCLGEDIVAPYGGAFKVTAGLSDQFPGQVFSTPISELGIVGLSNGLALSGYKPFVEIMFGDFSTLIVDQIVNGAVKFERMYGGKVKCPLKLRMPMGAGGGYGPTHSQSLEKLLCTIDGLDVVAPNRLLDPILFITAVDKSDKPTLMLEHKRDYPLKYNIKLPHNHIAEITDENYPTIIITPKKMKPSTCIFAYGNGINFALKIMKRLFIEEERFSKIVLLSKISPLNKNLIIEQASEVDEIVTIEDGCVSSGVGSEIIAIISEAGLGKRTFKRLGAKSSIIPSNINLENKVLVNDNQYWEK